MRFGILRKVLLIFYVLSTVPLIVVSVCAVKMMNDAGLSLLKKSEKTVIEKSMPLLVSKAEAVAEDIEKLLNKCVDDISFLSALPQTRSIHRKFYKTSRERIWVREGKTGDFVEISKRVPLYREVTFVNSKGALIYRNGRRYRKKTDFSGPFKGEYGVENYFKKAVNLKGKLYIGKVAGYHVSKESQLNGAKRVDDAVGGIQYIGIIRFAKAIFYKGELKGVVSIALDHRHLMERTQHIMPLSEKKTVFSKFASGNFAFAIDSDGWIITHPRFWYIRGADKKTGELFDTGAESFNKERLDKGLIPYNLVNTLTDYSDAAKKVISGKSGYSEINKGVFTVIYAPVKFNKGPYRKTAGFGAVILQVKTDSFKKSLFRLSDEVSQKKDELFKVILIILGINILVTFFLSYSYVSRIKKIMFRLTRKINDIISGDFTTSLNVATRDEFEALAENFVKLGNTLSENRKKRSVSVRNIEEKSIESQKRGRFLKKHVEILEEIYSHKDIFNNFYYYEAEYVYERILKSCVDIAGFELAEIYMEDSGVLKCVKVSDSRVAGSFGIDFTVKKESLQYKVYKRGEEVIVKDINLSRFDEELLVLSNRERSYSFIALPLYISGKIRGVIVADNLTSNMKITSSMENLIRIISKEASYALEKALILEEHIKNKYDFCSLSGMAESIAKLVSAQLKDVTLLLQKLYESDNKVDLIEKSLAKIDNLAELVNDLIVFTKPLEKPPIENDIMIIVSHIENYFGKAGNVKVDVEDSIRDVKILSDIEFLRDKIFNIFYKSDFKESGVENFNISVFSQTPNQTVLKISSEKLKKNGVYIYNPYLGKLIETEDMEEDGVLIVFKNCQSEFRDS